MAGGYLHDQHKPIGLSIMFSKAHKLTSNRLASLEEGLKKDGHTKQVKTVKLLRGEHMAIANAFLEVWKEFQK